MPATNLQEWLYSPATEQSFKRDAQIMQQQTLFLYAKDRQLQAEGLAFAKKKNTQDMLFKSALIFENATKKKLLAAQGRYDSNNRALTQKIMESDTFKNYKKEITLLNELRERFLESKAEWDADTTKNKSDFEFKTEDGYYTFKTEEDLDEHIETYKAVQVIKRNDGFEKEDIEWVGADGTQTKDKITDVLLEFTKKYNEDITKFNDEGAFGLAGIAKQMVKISGGDIYSPEFSTFADMFGIKKVKKVGE